MADKIGVNGVEKAIPKEKLDTSKIQETSLNKPVNLTGLPPDVNPTPKQKQSKNSDKNQKGDNPIDNNPIDNGTSPGLKETEYNNLNVGNKKNNTGMGNFSSLNNIPLPASIQNRLNNRRLQKAGQKAQKVQERAEQLRKLKDTFQKIQKTAKAIGSFIAKFWIPIVIVLVCVLFLIPLICALFLQVGNSPHFYCDLEAPPSIKSTAVYKQYCGGQVGGNDSIAQAAVSLAYHIPDIQEVETTYVAGKCSSGVSHSSRDKTGGVAPNDIATQLYVDVHDEVIHGDGYYASCDRGTCTAVRWAGADDDIPPGPCGTMMTYLENSNKWENCGTLNSEDQLEPGDIMICSHHVGIYVGEEAVKERYPNSNCTTYAASYGDHCPQLQTIDHWLAGHSKGGKYTIYRNVQPESDSKYKDLQF